MPWGEAGMLLGVQTVPAEGLALSRELFRASAPPGVSRHVAPARLCCASP